jgi:two-component system, OmpR family, response regulator
MRILIAEDDPILADGLTRAFRQSENVVDCVRNGREADSALSTQTFDVVLLDVGLPGMSGFEVLRRARERGLATPILILTALDAVDDRVRGLDFGADDYMVKPFELAELQARVRALTRRAHGQANPFIKHGALEFDPVSRMVTIHNTSPDLSVREIALLEIFLGRVGRLVSKDQIIDLMCQWGDEFSANAVEVYVHRLRKKLEPADIRISTVRGLGYCLEKPESSTDVKESAAGGVSATATLGTRTRSDAESDA